MAGRVLDYCDTTGLHFYLAGKPVSQGSKVSRLVGGKPIMFEAAKARLRDWRYAISRRASELMEGRPIWDDPVRLLVTFRFCRPKAHFRTGKFAGELKSTAPVWHRQKPDLDKLIRAVSDSLTGVVYRDDSQIFSLVATKNWSDDDEGCIITVEKIDASDGE